MRLKENRKPYPADTNAHNATVGLATSIAVAQIFMAVRIDNDI